MLNKLNKSVSRWLHDARSTKHYIIYFRKRRLQIRRVFQNAD
jgi:hypothetical protein